MSHTQSLVSGSELVTKKLWLYYSDKLQSESCFFLSCLYSCPEYSWEFFWITHWQELLKKKIEKSNISETKPFLVY